MSPMLSLLAVLGKQWLDCCKIHNCDGGSGSNRINYAIAHSRLPSQLVLQSTFPRVCLRGYRFSNPERIQRDIDAIQLLNLNHAESLQVRYLTGPHCLTSSTWCSLARTDTRIATSRFPVNKIILRSS
ncbi:hypothetical protein BDR07DRAFT_39221 [Suillus spraguei]|nr:hypothetical protein BDR07DRAFT_39221 [Suillus spraguei]